MGDTDQLELRAAADPTMDPTPKLQVLYVGGYSRSGSTVLANALGEIEGFFTAGEIMYVWHQLLAADARCGCQSHLSECPIWGPVTRSALGDPDPAEWRRMIDLLNSEWQTWKVPGWLLVPPLRRRLLDKMAAYLGALDSVYSAIGDRMSGQMVVDSSKNPAYLYFLMQLPRIDVRMVHIVRDPRGSAFSWRSDKAGFTPHGVAETARSWAARNSMLAMLGSRLGDGYLRIRYEDFVGDPVDTLGRICDLVGRPNRAFPFVEGDRIELGPNHLVYGNPDRFRTGPAHLRVDDRWRQMMPDRDRRLVAAMTWPLMRRFGYPFGS